MRLREPFAGYLLTSGHYLFHIAFFIGTFLPLKKLEVTTDDEADESEKAEFVFKCLRAAHVIVPCLDLFSFLAFVNTYYFLEKFFDTLEIFIYQSIIFYA